MDDLKRLVILGVLMVLFNFYYTFFRVTFRANRWLRPWKKALKRINF